MNKFEIAMNMLVVAIQKAERDVVELKDRANVNSHPDDKAEIAAKAAKVYAKLQGFQALQYDILDMVKNPGVSANTQDAELPKDYLTNQVWTDEVLCALKYPSNVRRVGVNHVGKLYIHTGAEEGITVQVLHRGLPIPHMVRA